MASMGHDSRGTTTTKDESLQTSSPRSALPLADPSRVDQVFPTLTAEQIARVAKRGRPVRSRSARCCSRRGSRRRPSSSSPGARSTSSGAPPRPRSSWPFRGPGQFTGESNMLSGRQALVSLVVSAPGEVIEVQRADLVDAPADRQRAQRHPDARVHPPPGRADRARASVTSCVVGSTFCQATLRVQEFLTRNGASLHVRRPRPRPGRAGPARRASTSASDEVPVLICRETVVLRNPTNLRDRRLPGLQRVHRRRLACATS